jgi:ADP-ribose pyrophosphatase YjhB (NUDIX family)
MSIWRPPSVVRTIAVGVIRRRDELLLMAVRDDAGDIKGWRPLGGSIEFGERAAEALKREFVEELGAVIAEPTLLTVIENLYSHHDATGHEIVFVFEAAFAVDAAYGVEHSAFDDGGVRIDVAWVPLAEFMSGQAKLFPAGLLDHLTLR